MKNKTRVSLFVAGGVSAFFTVFHGLMFYALLSNQNLVSPDPMMIRALLQTFNSVTLLMVAAMAYFSFRYPDELVRTSIGKSLLVVFGVFYLIRIASEFVFFGYSGVGSLVMIILCLLPALSYLVAAISPSQGIEAVHQM
jgi:uncharacterized protein YhhL (DUF1145 family)